MDFNSPLKLNHQLKFKNEIVNELKSDIRKIKLSNNNLRESEAQEQLNKLIEWLSNPPKNIVFRINPILCVQQVVIDHITNALKKLSRPVPKISTFSCIPELIVVNSWDDLTLDLTKQQNEVIVDSVCGAAILRGSHIYVPGVLGMPRSLKIGDKVSVYADIKQGCKKGLITIYKCESKLFVGNGIVQLTREQIFGQNLEYSSGIAVLMTDVISCIPQLNDSILPKGHIILQNLPSVLCSRILDPQPNETILDMCAAPGNKTTHIAALMENKGTVIALEKIQNKVDKLILYLENFSLNNIKVFCFDSTKAVCDMKNNSIILTPPFLENSFDRILLDGPCSALGQRPQISNSINISQLRSYVPLQRKLFSSAVRLLKQGGTLVYSTCTVTVAENEGIVAWAIKQYPNLSLQSINKKLINLKVEQFASVGYNIDGLSKEQSNKLCRFGYENDSIGFFIACFIKV